MSEVDIDDVVEDGEDEEGSQRCHCHPGPGGVPNDIILTQPQLCWLNISYLNHPILSNLSNLSQRKLDNIITGLSFVI